MKHKEEMITIPKQEYLNLIDRVGRIETEKGNIENLSDVHLASEKSLNEIWDNKKDDEVWEKYL